MCKTRESTNVDAQECLVKPGEDPAAWVSVCLQCSAWTRAAADIPDLQNLKHSKEYEIPEGTWESLQRHKARHDSEGRGFGYQRIADFSKQTRTLSARYAKDGAEILIKERYWRRPRKLTLTEAKLLMGFNDFYAKNYGHNKGFPIDICSKAQSYKQFGNSVVPKIVEEIANILIKLF